MTTPRPCVHLIPSTDDAGAENQALYLLRELRSWGRLPLELAYFAPGRNHDLFRELGIPLVELGRGGRLVLDWRRRARELRRSYAKRPPAIVHSWLFEANVVAIAATRRWDSRLVIGHRSGAAERDLPLHFRAIKRLYPRADRALSNSMEGAEMLVAAGLDPAAVAVVPQALPPDRIAIWRPRAAIRSELGVAETAPVVAALGRPDPAKDFAGLVTAMDLVWAQRPDAFLLLVGVTPDELAALGAHLPKSAAAVGWQEHPLDYLGAADVVAVPSLTEGHSNVADEALMLGRAVVTTDTGEHPRIVAEAGGRVVPVGRPEALAQGILQLIERPPTVEEVRAVARRHLDVAAAAQATLEVYEELLERA